MGEPSYIVVGEIGSTDEPVELPTGRYAIALSTITAYYPDAVSLRYRDAHGEFQRLRVSNGVVVAPPGGWANRKYYITIYKDECVPPNKSTNQESSSQEDGEIISTAASLEEGEIMSSATEEGEIKSTSDSQEEGVLSQDDVDKGDNDVNEHEGEVEVLEERYEEKCDISLPQDEEEEEEEDTRLDEEAGIDLLDDDILSEGDVNPDGISEEEEEELADLMKKKNKPKRKPDEDIIVFGLPWDARTPLLKNYFKQYGRVLYAYVKRWRYPKNRKMSGRYGFINFEDWEVAKKVLQQVHYVGGQQVKIRLAKKSEDQTVEAINARKRSREYDKCYKLSNQTTEGNYGNQYKKYSKYGTLIIDDNYKNIRKEFANQQPVVYNHLGSIQYGNQSVQALPQQEILSYQQYGSHSNQYGSQYDGGSDSRTSVSGYGSLTSRTAWNT